MSSYSQTLGRRRKCTPRAVLFSLAPTYWYQVCPCLIPTASRKLVHKLPTHKGYMPTGKWSLSPSFKAMPEVLVLLDSPLFCYLPVVSVVQLLWLYMFCHVLTGRRPHNSLGSQQSLAQCSIHRRVMNWTVSARNSYVEVLTISTSSVTTFGNRGIAG